MKPVLRTLLATIALLGPVLLRAQQANVNLDWDPQRNAEGLVPFSAPLNSPEVHADRTVTFRVRAPDARKVELNGAVLAAVGRNWGGVLSAGDANSEKSLAGFLNTPDVNAKVDYLFVGLGTLEAAGRFGERSENLRQALVKHGIRHEYYVGGHGAHDWATGRHLLHERFLPNLWRRSTP